jgi:hypothetical protein
LANRSKSPTSAHSPTAVSVSTPAQTPQPADLRRPRRTGQDRDDLSLEVIAAVDQHVNHALQVQQRRLRCRPVQAHRL